MSRLARNKESQQGAPPEVYSIDLNQLTEYKHHPGLLLLAILILASLIGYVTVYLPRQDDVISRRTYTAEDRQRIINSLRGNESYTQQDRDDIIKGLKSESQYSETERQNIINSLR